MIKTLETAARKSGQLLLEMQSSARLTKDKGGGNISLNADQKSQDAIKKILEKHFPTVPIVAEEDEPMLPLPESFFAIDPLDGTLPYSRGCDEWGVAIAYFEKRLPILGVLYEPKSNLLLSTIKGKGCFLNGAKMSGLTRNLANAYCLGLDMHYATHSEFITNVLIPMLPNTALVRSLGSAVVSTIAFARGHTDAHVNQFGGRIWDFANLALAAGELGALCCSLTGDELSWDKLDMNILVSHDPILGRKILDLAIPLAVNVNQ